MDTARSIMGVIARALFWLCVLDIVANAVTQAVSSKQCVLGVFEVVGFPATYVLYPFLQPPAGNAWPWADGHTLIPVLVLGVIAYPVSTLIGRMDPVQ
jgi:hypothetical protein